MYVKPYKKNYSTKRKKSKGNRAWTLPVVRLPRLAGLASAEPGALRHGSKVTSVTLPSRYTFPSVLRTKMRVVEDSVSGSS